MRIWFWFFLVLAPATAFGAPKKACGPQAKSLVDRLKIPDAIERNPKADVRAAEVAESGTFVARGSKLPGKIEGGVYPYLIYDDESVMLTPRLVDKSIDTQAPGAKFLGSHRSAVAKATAKRGAVPRVVGAGEVEIRWIWNKEGTALEPVVYRLSNRSNTFHGEMENLQHSAQTLKDVGFDIRTDPNGPQTEFVNFSPNSGGKKPPESHLADELAARLASRVKADPKLQKVMKRLDQYQAQLIRSHPSLHRLGRVDQDWVDGLLKASEHTPDGKNIRDAVQWLTTWDKEGSYWPMAIMLKREMTPEKMMETITTLEKYLGH